MLELKMLLRLYESNFYMQNTINKKMFFLENYALQNKAM